MSDECVRCETGHDLEETKDGITMCVDCIIEVKGYD